ncbi:hypothetical protein STEG23_005594, partial [Scotinomys teguina]
WIKLHGAYVSYFIYHSYVDGQLQYSHKQGSNTLNTGILTLCGHDNVSHRNKDRQALNFRLPIQLKSVQTKTIGSGY